jgi:peptidoglycan/xylan/chitin deacetylase (PgdA/CDA1 family)
MDPTDQRFERPRRADRERARRRRTLLRRIGAVSVVIVVIAVVAVVVITTVGGGSSRHDRRDPGRVTAATHKPHKHHAKPAAAAAHAGSTADALAPGNGAPGDATVPILMYHVINDPPTGAPFPLLYVPATEFDSQMQALKDAGWVAVTLDQLRANWTTGAKLPTGKPFVLTFDNGYYSQYSVALPELKRLHWVADENMQLTGLPPSQGGLTNQEIQAMVNAGWELDTQGISHADLVELSPTELHDQVYHARRTIQHLFHVPVNWFCYPSGQYDATVIDAVKAAGYTGSTTVVPGWASRTSDPYELPRLRIVGGTTPAELLSQISSSQTAPPPPSSYTTSSPGVG